MDTANLKKFAQAARRSLMEQVTARLNQVLREGSAARREQTQAVAELEKQIRQTNKAQVIERVAYLWFNRFCALRFMDANRYTRIGIVSPAAGQVQPELMADAKLGHMDDEMVPARTQQQILDLLAGKTPSRDPQAEAYRLLLVAACNHYAQSMPFLFERIYDYTELLLPDDLLSGTSVLAQTRAAMTADACAGVEVIGWLYQFYIAEKKDEVFEGLKKNKKITPENIPAATQLFTPHWIVRYLVENSLGRLWMLNRPNSRLAAQMDYYIQPEQAETDFLRVRSPEELKICDSASGSGHMLVYAFDLLYAIYEEEGYAPAEIPAKILTHNLYGIEIDDRAGALAAFALTMKARAYDRRFFSRKTATGEPVKPNICVLQNIEFSSDELNQYMDFVGCDLFTAPLVETLHQFAEAKHFGSLIRPIVTDVAAMQARLEATNVSGHLFLSQTHEKVHQVLSYADYLSPKYHIVIANPPYMGGKGMDAELKDFAGLHYPIAKSDLFAMFIERNLELAKDSGLVAMVTMQSWMFLSSFEALRELIVKQKSIKTLVQIGYNSFPELNSKIAQACAFVLENSAKHLKGIYLNLNDVPQAADKNTVFIEKKQSKDLFSVNQHEFTKIPGSPVAYWLSEGVRAAFGSFDALRSISIPRQGNTTTDNNRFVRSWSEVSRRQLGTDYESAGAFQDATKKWAPYNKGGGSRRWFGQNYAVVNWEKNGLEIKAIPHSVIANESSYFSPGLTWSTISTSGIGFRYFGNGFIFDNKGACIFVSEDMQQYLAALLNTKVFVSILYQINPTVSLQPGDVAKFPVIPQNRVDQPAVLAASDVCVHLAKSDWNSYETSWDFTCLPLLTADYRQPTLEATYARLRAHWQEMTLEMQQMEEENNHIFIDAYGLQEELTPEVPLNEITLTCNPHYRYGGDKSKAELEALLLADTLKEFISYAVGCMFGRYSLDKPGLILANQGETLADYLRQIPNPTFPADEDNAIPMLDGDWFPDDVSERFRTFLRVTFGEAHYAENLAFIEAALGKEIRKYFLRDFYNDHVRRYKKRPIYWLFSSPQGSFNVLIYMHRYRPDTVSVVLNEYLREFRTKLTARKSHLAAVSISGSEAQGTKTKALKEIEALTKVIAELESYEREVLYPLATQQISIDLDDGVKVNYLKFGTALKKIAGLEAKDE